MKTSSGERKKSRNGMTVHAQPKFPPFKIDALYPRFPRKKGSFFGNRLWRRQLTRLLIVTKDVFSVWEKNGWKGVQFSTQQGGEGDPFFHFTVSLEGGWLPKKEQGCHKTSLKNFLHIKIHHCLTRSFKYTLFLRFPKIACII